MTSTNIQFLIISNFTAVVVLAGMVLVVGIVVTVVGIVVPLGGGVVKVTHGVVDSWSQTSKS